MSASVSVSVTDSFKVSLIDYPCLKIVGINVVNVTFVVNAPKNVVEHASGLALALPCAVRYDPLPPKG